MCFLTSNSLSLQRSAGVFGVCKGSRGTPRAVMSKIGPASALEQKVRRISAQFAYVRIEVLQSYKMVVF